MLTVGLRGRNAREGGILADTFAGNNRAPRPRQLADVNRPSTLRLQIHREFALAGLLDLDT